MIQDELLSSRLKLNLTRKAVVKLSGIKETEFIKLENGNYRKMNPNDFEKLESVLKLDRTFKKMYVSPYSDLTFLKERREKLGYTLREAEKLTGINIMQISRMENGKTLRVSLSVFEKMRKGYKLRKSANYDHLILANSKVKFKLINKEKFLEIVKERRKEFGYTQRDLANMCNLDHTAISKLEGSKPSISIETAIKLMNALDFDNALKSRYLVKK